MEKKSLLLLVACMVILLSSELNAVSIQFYKNKDYTDLLFQSASTAICNNVPGHQVFVGSVKTDTCLIMYRNSHCKSDRSWKKLPQDSKNSSTSIAIGSYHICNENEGGPILNVDITTTNSDTPVLLQSYKNVCTCQNIPTNVQQRNTWSINNHGNELKAYYEPDCSEQKIKSLSIRAGHSRDSMRIYSHEKQDPTTNKMYKIQSFGPDPNSIYFDLSCPKPPSIMDLELLEPLNVTDRPADLWANDLQINGHSGFKLSDDMTKTQIFFYSNPNYKVYLSESSSIFKCNNVPKPGDPQWVSGGISSVKTNTCLMLYSNYDCGGRSIKIESEGNANLPSAWESTVTGPATLSLLYEKKEDWKWDTKSFHVCSANEHASSLNVDLTEYHDSVKSTSVPKILQSYRDTCTCQNIPRYIQERNHWSINNFDNSLIAYFEQDCESTLFDPLWIPAGHSSFSNGFGSFNKTEVDTGFPHKIQSFGPDPNSKYFRRNCVKLYSTIIKFEIMEPQNGANSPLNYVERNIEMTASKTMFRNRGPAQLSQTYSASKSVREAFQLDIGTSLSKMNGVSVDNSFDVDIKRGSSGSKSQSTQNHKDWGKSDSKSEGKNQELGISESNSRGSQQGYENSSSKSQGSSQQLGQTESSSKGFNQGYGNSQTDSRGNQAGFTKSGSESSGSHQGYGNSGSNSMGSNTGHSQSNSQSQGNQQGWNKGESNSKGNHTGYSDLESTHLGTSIGSQTNVGGSAKFMGFGVDASQTISLNANVGHDTSSTKSGGNNVNEESSSSKSGSSNVGGEQSYSTSGGTNFNQESSSSASGGSNVGHEESLSMTGGNNAGHESSSSNSGGTNEEIGKSSSINKGMTSEMGKSSGTSGSSSKGNEKSTSASESKSVGHEESSSMSGGRRIGSESSFSFSQDSSFREGLRKAYETSESRSTSQSNSTTIENSRTFTVTQMISVPSCSEHVVHAYVKMVMNKRIEYRALAKITGQLGGRDMSAAEVLQFMDRKLEYMGEFDANTVLAYSKGHFKAEYGVSSLISAKGHTLHDCVAENQLGACPVCETCNANDADNGPGSDAHPSMNEHYDDHDYERTD